MLDFITLGPEGSNHVFVLRRYLAAHGLQDTARVVLADDFHAAARDVVAERADYLLQCAVHPAAADITGAFRRELRVIDAFISPSRPMALVRATSPPGHAGADVGSVCVQPATQHYADLSPWPRIVHAPTVSAVHEGLLAGRYAAGIVFTALVEEWSHRFEIVESIGTVCDAWMVYGREAVDAGEAVVWTSSPVSQQYRRRVSTRATRS